MNRRLLIRGAVMLLLAAAVIAVWLSPLRESLNRESIRSGVEDLRALWYGPAAFIGVFALGCVLALPSSIFIIAAGFIWGWWLGGAYAMVGAVIGAVACFLLGRFVGEGLLARFGRVGRLVARQVDHAGFSSLLFIRFIPGIPFPVVNYGAGVAGVRLRDFVPATILGIGPPVFVFAYCADALFNGSMSEGDAIQRLLIVSGLMLTLMLLPLLVRRLTKQPPVSDVTAE
ncbi:MAG TPA: VTT domain-containing protein [Thermoanaerobaculia bacterium]